MMIDGLLHRIWERIILRHSWKIKALRKSLYVYVFIFVIWGLYRLLLRFPVVLEEMVLKPVVFLLPIAWIQRREKRGYGQMVKSLGFNSRNLWFSLYFGLTLGIVYLVIAFLGRSVFSGVGVIGDPSDLEYRILMLMVISLATALWEQLFFSGFLLLRFQEILNNEWQSVSLTASLFMLLHLPIIWLESGVGWIFMLMQLVMLWFIGFGNSVLMLRTRNILAPIISHTFWAFTFQLIS